MHTPGLPVAWAKPSAMWPAPCSWRTRMWRIGLSMIGSYTGRIAPPGRPKMISTPSISRARIRACPPSIFMAGRSLVRSGCGGMRWAEVGRKLERPPGGRSEGRTRDEDRRALDEDYEGVESGHRRPTLGSTARKRQDGWPSATSETARSPVGSAHSCSRSMARLPASHGLGSPSSPLDASRWTSPELHPGDVPRPLVVAPLEDEEGLRGSCCTEVLRGEHRDIDVRGPHAGRCTGVRTPGWRLNRALVVAGEGDSRERATRDHHRRGTRPSEHLPRADAGGADAPTASCFGLLAARRDTCHDDSFVTFVAGLALESSHRTVPEAFRCGISAVSCC